MASPSRLSTSRPATQRLGGGHAPLIAGLLLELGQLGLEPLPLIGGEQVGLIDDAAGEGGNVLGGGREGEKEEKDYKDGKDSRDLGENGLGQTALHLSPSPGAA